MNVAFAIARRLYRNETKGNRSSLPAVRIAVVSVALGTAVMLLSVAVAFGFSDSIRGKVTSVGSDIVITAAASSSQLSPSEAVEIDSTLLNAIIRSGNISRISAVASCQGVLKTEKAFAPLSFKGVGKDYDTRFLSSSLVEGRLPNFGKSDNREILISRAVSKSLSLKTGDKVYAYFFSEGDLRVRRFLITGIYATEISMFDENLVFASFSDVSKLCGFTPSQASALELTVSNPDSLDACTLRTSKVISYYNIKHNTSLSAVNIKQMYPQIFAWLSLLNVNITVILVIMLLVSGVTMVTSLLIIILERASTIALLSALGAGQRLLGRTFLMLAMMILVRGMLIGNALALALCFLQDKLHVFTLDPQSYYLDYVPVEFSLPAFLEINALIFVVCAVTLYLPSRLVSAIRPVEVLRHE